MKGLKLALIALLAAPFIVVPDTHAQLPSLVLDWTASGDDDNVGTASKYDLRYSTVRPDTLSEAAKDAWWIAAVVVPGLPAPKAAGEQETFTVTGPFAAGQTFHFVLRIKDDAGNWSGWSNVAWRAVPDAVPPRACSDLRIR